MPKTIQSREEASAWQEQYDPLAPKEGDRVPDFGLRDADGENSVRLSDFRDEQPVALIFGSFT